MMPRLISYGLISFVILAFSCAFVASAMGAMGVTRPPKATRRGMHPLVVGCLVAIAYAAFLHARTLTIFQAMMFRAGPPPQLQEPLVVVLIAVAGATAVVAQIGLAREILAAAYIATAASIFAMPFVANLSANTPLSLALMVSFVPAGLGLVLGASMAWPRRRERAALRSLSSPS